MYLPFAPLSFFKHPCTPATYCTYRRDAHVKVYGVRYRQLRAVSLSSLCNFSKVKYPRKTTCDSSVKRIMNSLKFLLFWQSSIECSIFSHKLGTKKMVENDRKNLYITHNNWINKPAGVLFCFFCKRDNSYLATIFCESKSLF